MMFQWCFYKGWCIGHTSGKSVRSGGRFLAAVGYYSKWCMPDARLLPVFFSNMSPSEEFGTLKSISDPYGRWPCKHTLIVFLFQAFKNVEQVILSTRCRLQLHNLVCFRFRHFNILSWGSWSFFSFRLYESNSHITWLEGDACSLQVTQRLRFRIFSCILNTFF